MSNIPNGTIIKCKCCGKEGPKAVNSLMIVDCKLEYKARKARETFDLKKSQGQVDDNYERSHVMTWSVGLANRLMGEMRTSNEKQTRWI